MLSSLHIQQPLNDPTGKNPVRATQGPSNRSTSTNPLTWELFVHIWNDFNSIMSRGFILLEPHWILSVRIQDAWKCLSIQHIQLPFSCDTVVREEWTNQSVIPRITPHHHTLTSLLFTAIKPMRVLRGPVMRVFAIKLAGHIKVDLIREQDASGKVRVTDHFW